MGEPLRNSSPLPFQSDVSQSDQQLESRNAPPQWEEETPIYRGPPNRPVYKAPPKSLSDEEKEGESHRESFEEAFKRKVWRGVDDPAQISPSSTHRALVIAINYRGLGLVSELPGTYIDAHRIIQMLGKLGYKSDEICVLADIPLRDSNGDHQKPPRWPSKKNIQKGLEWLADGNQTVGSAERRFLFFAGHGHRQVTREGITEGPWIANEGIVPRDIEFQEFKPCEGCKCDDPRWDVAGGDRKSTPGTLWVPEAALILWDYSINETLANKLRPGTKLTVVFDCCHSGGTVRSTIFNGTNATEIWRNSMRERSIEFTDTILPDSSTQLESGESAGLIGNLLGLPVHTKIVDSTPKVLSRRTLSPACRLLANAGVKRSSVAFDEECEVICWAACTDVQSSLEQEYIGGRFTEAFTAYVNEHDASVGTYRGLNNRLRDVFNTYNNNNSRLADGSWRLQHPQVYATNNVASVEDYFKGRLCM